MDKKFLQKVFQSQCNQGRCRSTSLRGGQGKTRTFKQQNFQDVSANIYVYEYQRIMSVAVWLTNHLWVSQFQEIDWQAVQYSFNLSSAQSTKDLLKLISTPD